MEIIAVEHKNLKVSGDDSILDYFDSIQKAITFCEDYLIKHNAREPSGLLPKDPSNYIFYPRFTYYSFYGHYPMELRLVSIIVK